MREPKPCTGSYFTMREEFPYVCNILFVCEWDGGPITKLEKSYAWRK
jgi:hypothetical protein